MLKYTKTLPVLMVHAYQDMWVLCYMYGSMCVSPPFKKVDPDKVHPIALQK